MILQVESFEERLAESGGGNAAALPNVIRKVWRLFGFMGTCLIS